jgi:hypothetical protein
MHSCWVCSPPKSGSQLATWVPSAAVTVTEGIVGWTVANEIRTVSTAAATVRSVIACGAPPMARCRIAHSLVMSSNRCSRSSVVTVTLAIALSLSSRCSVNV